MVIAIDVGTTFSGVSYAILRPGEIPFIQGVTRLVLKNRYLPAHYLDTYSKTSRFPDQDRVAGDKKVPSVMYYDETGQVRAAGATAQDQNTMDQAEDEGWTKVEQ